MLDSTCNFVFRGFRGVIPFEHMSVALIEGEPPRVRLCWQRSELPERGLRVGYATPLDMTTLGEVVRSGRPRILNDLEAYLRDRPSSSSTRQVVARGIRSSLTCPLIVEDRTVGFVFFSSAVPGAYMDHHVTIVERIARDLAMVLMGSVAGAPRSKAKLARLGSALEDLAELVGSGQEEALLLREITEKVNAGVGMSQVLDQVYSQFLALLPYDRIGFAQVDPGGERVSACWARSNGSPIMLDAGFSQRLEEGSLGGVLRNGVPRVIDDLEAYMRARPSSLSTKLIVREGMRSSLTCPLLALGRPVGFLFFASRQPAAYQPVHIARLSRLAAQLAMIIEKGRLYEELDRARRVNDALLRGMMPGPIVDALQAGAHPRPRIYDSCTVIQVDLVGYTERCLEIPPSTLLDFLDELFGSLDMLAERWEVTKISVVGDAWIGVSGVPTPTADHLDRAVGLTQEVHESLAQMRWPAGEAVQARIGLGSGSVVGGLVGRQGRRFDIWGPTVNLACRLQAEGDAGRTLAEAPLPEAAGRFWWEPAGDRRLKGIGVIKTAWVRPLRG